PVVGLVLAPAIGQRLGGALRSGLPPAPPLRPPGELGLPILVTVATVFRGHGSLLGWGGKAVYPLPGLSRGRRRSRRACAAAAERGGGVRAWHPAVAPAPVGRQGRGRSRGQSADPGAGQYRRMRPAASVSHSALSQW